MSSLHYMRYIDVTIHNNACFQHLLVAFFLLVEVDGEMESTESETSGGKNGEASTTSIEQGLEELLGAIVAALQKVIFGHLSYQCLINL